MQVGLILSLIVIIMASYSQAANILLFPYGHCLNSHLFNMEKLAGILIQVGKGYKYVMIVTVKYAAIHIQAGKDYFMLVTVKLVDITSRKRLLYACNSKTHCHSYTDKKILLYVCSSVNLMSFYR